MEENTIKNNTPEEKEIDLLALGKKLWDRKKFILKVMGIGAVIGLVVAFSIPKEYTTTVVLVPDAQSPSSGTMGSLAALAGINVSGSVEGDALASPSLYPNIFQSTPFLKGLFEIPIKKDTINTTIYTYIKEYEKKSWWGYIFNAPSYLIKRVKYSDSNIRSNAEKDSSRIISDEETSVIESLRNKLVVNSDKKTGITTIEVTMQDPAISAFIADTLTLYLQSYIIKYRTQKAREDLSYAEELHREAKENYNKAQANLASFIDGNMNVVSARYRIIQDGLQNEASLAYSVYNQTAQQVQLAKIKVQNTTPVLTIIQPAVEPLFPVVPKKKVIVAVFIFLSIIGSAIWILRKDLWAYLNHEAN